MQNNFAECVIRTNSYSILNKLTERLKKILYFNKHKVLIYAINTPLIIEIQELRRSPETIEKDEILQGKSVIVVLGTRRPKSHNVNHVAIKSRIFQ